MSLLLTGGAVFLDGKFHTVDLAVDQGRIVSVSISHGSKRLSKVV